MYEWCTNPDRVMKNLKKCYDHFGIEMMGIKDSEVMNLILGSAAIEDDETADRELRKVIGELILKDPKCVTEWKDNNAAKPAEPAKHFLENCDTFNFDWLNLDGSVSRSNSYHNKVRKFLSELESNNRRIVKMVGVVRTCDAADLREDSPYGDAVIDSRPTVGDVLNILKTKIGFRIIPTGSDIPCISFYGSMSEYDGIIRNLPASILKKKVIEIKDDEFYGIELIIDNIEVVTNK